MRLRRFCRRVRREDENLPSPSVLLVIGVNGVGKTTTIGKLAHNFKEDGKSVLLAAADTFRAAAIDQLEIWGERSDIPVIKHEENSDPAAVVYDAVHEARKQEYRPFNLRYGRAFAQQEKSDGGIEEDCACD